jgi:Cu(I)/Ag(I) efflux system periplasmic protein CusF
MKKLTCFAVAMMLGSFSALAFAGAQPAANASAAAPTIAMSNGEVIRIDKQARKIAIKHGPLVNLDMPPMTMVFGVKDAAWLDRLKVGDKIRFVAGKEGTAFVASHLEMAK